jgi:tRNA-splicing ligase RtcB (3'-phosphate/5'-hydroxy nucleic acid ligase)
MRVEKQGQTEIKLWTTSPRGEVPVEPKALAQLRNVARLPFVFRHVAAMPDVHLGIGATVGSVIATRGAIVPAAVGVDIGCGMEAVRTALGASELPDSLGAVRSAIEEAVPHGRTNQGGPGDRGAWGVPPAAVAEAWSRLGKDERYQRLVEKHPKVDRNAAPDRHLGTLGTGNHFIELCLDEADRVWIMLHSGSRGIGNRIGTHFIERAKQEIERSGVELPDPDLAYLPESSKLFADYVAAVGWAQDYAAANRRQMLRATTGAVEKALGRPLAAGDEEAISCHHNYVARERHFGEDVLVTRKGAVNASAGRLGIIPGSMGKRSYIVRGKGNPDSFESCSHGAGRAMSRGEAKRRFTLADLRDQTEGVECRKDEGVLDEIPGAYKDLDLVMAAQADLVEVVHTLRAVLTVKG